MSNFTTGVEWNSSFVVPSNYPLNALDIADNVAEVLAKLPTNRRYVGLSVFLLDENKVYRFTKHDDGAGGLTSGILDSDFQPEQSSGFDITKWQTNKDYAKDTYVVYNYKLYKALEDVVGGVTFDESKFELYIGDSSSGGVFKTTSPITNKIGQFGLDEEYTDADNISLNEAINMILHSNIDPEIEFGIVGTDAVLEIGQAIPLVKLRLAFTKVGNGTITNIQFYKNGVEFGTPVSFVDGTSEYIKNDMNISNDTDYKVIVTYNFGKGDKTIEKEINCRFVKRSFYGTTKDDSFVLDSDNIRLLSGNKLALKKGDKININISSGDTEVILAYPSIIGEVSSIIFKEGFNSEIKDSFTKQIVQVKDLGTTLSDYNVYYYKPINPYSKDYTYIVTI